MNRRQRCGRLYPLAYPLGRSTRQGRRRRTAGTLVKGHYAVAGIILYARTVCPAAAGVMKFKVYLLRRSGRRLPWREVQNGPHYVGHLITHSVLVKGQRYQAATLQPADPMAEPLVLELYEPVLIGFTVLGFQLRGFERIEGSAGPMAVVQEWHCETP